MYGNGWAWSTAKGVRIGKICWWKTSVRYARSRSPSVSKSTIANPCAASAGRTCSAKMALCRATSSVVRSAIAANCSAGPIPSGERSPQSGRDLVLEPGDPHLEELVEPLGEDARGT